MGRLRREAVTGLAAVLIGLAGLIVCAVLAEVTDNDRFLAFGWPFFSVLCFGAALILAREILRIDPNMRTFSSFLAEFVDGYAEGKLCTAAQDTADAVGEKATEALRLRAADVLIGLHAELVKRIVLERNEDVREALNSVAELVEGATTNFIPAGWWDELAKANAEAGEEEDAADARHRASAVRLQGRLDKLYREQLCIRLFQLFPVEYQRLEDVQRWMGVTEHEAEQALGDLVQDGRLHLEDLGKDMADRRWALSGEERREAIEKCILELPVDAVEERRKRYQIETERGLSAADARILADLFTAIPNEAIVILEQTDSQIPVLIRRIRKLANTPDARSEEGID